MAMLMDMGMTRDTARKATEEIHRDETRALNSHLVQELGVDPSEEAVALGRGRLVVPDVRRSAPSFHSSHTCWATSRCGSAWRSAG